MVVLVPDLDVVGLTVDGEAEATVVAGAVGVVVPHGGDTTLAGDGAAAGVGALAALVAALADNGEAGAAAKRRSAGDESESDEDAHDDLLSAGMWVRGEARSAGEDISTAEQIEQKGSRGRAGAMGERGGGLFLP